MGLSRGHNGGAPLDVPALKAATVGSSEVVAASAVALSAG